MFNGQVLYGFKLLCDMHLTSTVFEVPQENIKGIVREREEREESEDREERERKKGKRERFITDGRTNRGCQH